MICSACLRIRKAGMYTGRTGRSGGGVDLEILERNHKQSSLEETEARQGTRAPGRASSGAAGGWGLLPQKEGYCPVFNNRLSTGKLTGKRLAVSVEQLLSSRRMSKDQQERLNAELDGDAQDRLAHLCSGSRTTWTERGEGRGLRRPHTQLLS